MEDGLDIFLSYFYKSKKSDLLSLKKWIDSYTDRYSDLSLIDFFKEINSNSILNLSNLKIKKINKFLFVFVDKSFIDLSNNEIIEVPDNIVQKDAGIDFSHNNIKKFPKNLKQKNNLIFSYNHIEYIPKCFIQKDILDLSHNNIIMIPKDFKMGHSLNLSNNKISIIPDNFQMVYHRLNLSNNFIRRIPKGMSDKDPFNHSLGTVLQLDNNPIDYIHPMHKLSKFSVDKIMEENKEKIIKKTQFIENCQSINNNLEKGNL